jgi:hypothetical protein
MAFLPLHRWLPMVKEALATTPHGGAACRRKARTRRRRRHPARSKMVARWERSDEAVGESDGTVWSKHDYN